MNDISLGQNVEPDRKSIAEIVDEHRDVFETIANAEEELPEGFRQRYTVNILRAAEEQ